MPQKAQFFVLGNVGAIVVDVGIIVATTAAVFLLVPLSILAILPSISLVHVVVVVSAATASHSLEDVEDFFVGWYR